MIKDISYILILKKFKKSKIKHFKYILFKIYYIFIKKN